MRVVEKWNLFATVRLFKFPGLQSHQHQGDVPSFRGFGFWKIAHLQERQSRSWGLKMSYEWKLKRGRNDCLCHLWRLTFQTQMRQRRTLYVPTLNAEQRVEVIIRNKMCPDYESWSTEVSVWRLNMSKQASQLCPFSEIPPRRAEGLPSQLRPYLPLVCLLCNLTVINDVPLKCLIECSGVLHQTVKFKVTRYWRSMVE